MLNRLLARWTIAILLTVIAAGQAWGQPRETSADASSRAPAPVPAQTLSTSAEETRNELGELMRRYPPDLARVLKLDPSLLTNESYMSAYPQLRALLAQHPEILRTPDYYLGGVWTPPEPGPGDEAVALWQIMMDYGLGLLVFGVVTAVLVWLVRITLEQRRWSRLSRVQTEVHTKLLDRFGSNEDVLAYMNTSPGKRFLEAAPIPIDAAPSPGLGAPVSRILWSIQAGVVLSALGIGLYVVRGYVAPMIAPPLLIMGTVTLSIGIGLIVSAIVSYALSRKLGLLETPAPAFDSEEAGSSAS
jgi:hypothetical protein